MGRKYDADDAADQYDQRRGRGPALGTIRAIAQAPTLATFTFRAQNQWMGGGHNRSTIQGFYGAGQEDTSRKSTFVMDNDEPDVLLGTDQGANPVEYVLHALAGCLTTSLVYHAAAKGIRIDAVESRLEGDLDLRGFLGMSDEVRNGYDNVCDLPDQGGRLGGAAARVVQARAEAFAGVRHRHQRSAGNRAAWQ